MTSVTRQELSNSAMNKAQKRIIPFILLMYVIAFLDRTNIGFAKQAFQVSTGISDAAYALGAGIFFLGYAIFEVPSNIILHHVGARRWLSRIMITWGLVAAGFALVRTENQFLVLRVLLGIAEAGFFPGIIYYITLWFPSRRRGTINGLFYFGAPLSNIIGGPLSGLLMEMDGVLGLHGWQWLFSVEGLLASIIGIVALRYLVDKPEDASWLTKDEKQALLGELAEEKSTTGHGNPLKVLGNPKVLLLSLIYFMIQVAVYGVTFYLPTQVAGLLGKKVGLEVGLVSAIPWAFALIANAIIPRYSDKSGQRGSLAALLLAVAGFGVIVSTTKSPLLGILALSIATVGYFSAQPLFWLLPAQFLFGVEAASATGLINSIGNLGGFVAPNLRVWAEQAFHNPSAGLYSLGIAALVGALLFVLAMAFGMGRNAKGTSGNQTTEQIAK